MGSAPAPFEEAQGEASFAQCQHSKDGVDGLRGGPGNKALILFPEKNLEKSSKQIR